ncbi:MAG: DsbA family oxidoreductase [Actinomycetota bacterium]
MSDTSTITVEVWSDVVCPWCYIGKRRFESALETFGAEHPDVEVDIRYRAFLLDPTAPVGESLPVREAYEKKFGGADAATAIFDKVTTEAAGEGLEFKMDIAQRSNTILAHRLLVLGEKLGNQYELKERLMAAYFTEGKAIGTVEELVALAAEVGIDAEEARAWLQGDAGRDEVAAQLEFAADNGLTGVPTFVFNRKVAVPGAQQPELFIQILERQLAGTESA